MAEVIADLLQREAGSEKVFGAGVAQAVRAPGRGLYAERGYPSADDRRNAGRR